MINFTVGPVQMDEQTVLLGKNQIPYFRTVDFSEIMLENEKLLCTFFDAPENSRCVFITGSGTASMEGGIMNFFDSDDKVLVVNGGSFGHRFVELCQIHNITYTEIKLGYGCPLEERHLKEFDGKGYTGFIVQLCETSTGVLYNMSLIGEFCERNNTFLLVDAVSGFMADKFSMKQMHVNAAITGSQKALSLPPSMSFTILDEKAITRCKKINVRNLYFNYPRYLSDGERGQTPFTPAVATLLQLNEKLKRIDETGGVEYQNTIVRQRALYFRNKIKGLPFYLFTKPECSSNCLTALCPASQDVSAYKLFEIIKDEYGIWVCPNAGDMAEKVFRVGHIGNISYEEIDRLIEVFNDLNNRHLV